MFAKEMGTMMITSLIFGTWSAIMAGAGAGAGDAVAITMIVGVAVTGTTVAISGVTDTAVATVAVTRVDNLRRALHD